MTPDALLWIALAVGLYMAWNIGANDVANAMGTSVGSGALTFRRAVLVAAVFELAGAVLAGGAVTDTVRSGIIDTSHFATLDRGWEMLAAGMTASLLASAIWLHLASALGWPVSTTHAIVGAIAGFGIVASGLEAVQLGTLGKIAGSWVVSPLMGGVLGLVVFRLVRRLVLESARPLEALKRQGPWLVMPVFVVLTLSFVYKGLKNLKLDLSLGAALLVALAVGAVAMLVARRLLRRLVVDADAPLRGQLKTIERVFGYLQIMTACLVAFAHGSNDVANAVGPLAAVVSAVEEHAISSKVPLPIWVLWAGGIGIVVGLATYGRRVMATIGKRITEMTPTRGFAAEFGAATTILIGSKLGMPISTTHTLVGAVIGVGLARGLGAIDLGVIKGILASWLITVPLAAVLSGVIFWGLELVLGLA